MAKDAVIEEFAEEMKILEDLAKQAIDFGKTSGSKTKPEDERVVLRKCKIIVVESVLIQSSCRGNIVQLTTWHAEADKHGPIGGLGRWVPKVEVFCDTCKVLYRE